MKSFIVVLSVVLLAAPALAQERADYPNHPIFEADRKAHLAINYLEGRGVQKSNTEALKWWIIARALERPIEHINSETPFRCGYEMAVLEAMFAALEERMPDHQIAQAQSIAREWLEAHPQ